jgi:hypothetical protein
MDPIPDSKEAHEHEQPKTAVEEAMMRIGSALQSASRDYKSLPLLSLRKRFFMQGVIKSLTIVFEMLHELHHKWDNQHGTWN